MNVIVILETSPEMLYTSQVIQTEEEWTQSKAGSEKILHPGEQQRIYIFRGY